MFTNCLGITPYLSSVTWWVGWKCFAVKGTEVSRWSDSHEGSLLISDGAWAPSSFFPSCAQWPSVSQARSCQRSRILFSLVPCCTAVTIRSRRSAQGKLCGWLGEKGACRKEEGIGILTLWEVPRWEWCFTEWSEVSEHHAYSPLQPSVSTSVKWTNKDLPTTPVYCKH